jgi:hypothetical protein
VTVRTSVRIPRGKKIVCVPGCPLRTWTEFLREPPRATMAIVEAPVVYTVHSSFSSLTLRGIAHNSKSHYAART